MAEQSVAECGTESQNECGTFRPNQPSRFALFRASHHRSWPPWRASAQRDLLLATCGWKSCAMPYSQKSMRSELITVDPWVSFLRGSAAIAAFSGVCCRRARLARLTSSLHEKTSRRERGRGFHLSIAAA